MGQTNDNRKIFVEDMNRKVNPFQKPEPTKFEEAKKNLNDGIRAMIKSIVLAGLVVALEATAIHLMLSYVFGAKYPFTLLQTTMLFLCLRWIRRGTIGGNSNVSKNQN